VFALMAHLRRFTYDILHVHLFPARLWVAMAAQKARTGAALITTEHSTFNRRRRPVFRPLDRWIYAQYRLIPCISSATEDSLVQWLPETAGKTRVCSNGIDLDAFAAMARVSRSELLSLPEKTPIVLSVGRLAALKDHKTAIRALALVPGAHLVLAGDGPMMAELQALVAKLGLAERVHFLGRRPDVPRLMKAADLFVQCSQWEGFGLAALEAMASGLPVVTTRVPGLTDVVGNAGLLFDPGNYRQLADQLRVLLNNTELRNKLRVAGLARAQCYSLETTLDCYESAFRETLVRGLAG
jgi:glycosyltransferase involved in cell wall biosynthesis